MKTDDRSPLVSPLVAQVGSGLSATDVPRPERILRLPAVIAKTGISRSGIYQLMKSGDFPQSIKISARSVGWQESRLEEWVSRRVGTHRG